MRTFGVVSIAVFCAVAASLPACAPQSADSSMHEATGSASTTASPAPAGPAMTASPAVTDAASRIFLDPVTGEPREPTAAEIAELDRREALGRAARDAASRPTKPAAATEFYLPDGTVGVRLPEGDLQHLQVCLDADGNVDEHCESATLPPARKSAPARQAAPAAGAPR